MNEYFDLFNEAFIYSTSRKPKAMSTVRVKKDHTVAKTKLLCVKDSTPL